MSNQVEKRIAEKLFPKEKPMQRARARRINPAEKTLREIADALGIKPSTKQNYPHAIRRYKPE